mgnify:CR=1 FL=1
MILGLGIDLCPVDRIRDVIERQGDAFLSRVYTPAERDYATGAMRFDRLAARWAAKEAAIKALGGVSGIDWHDLCVVNADSGAPSLVLAGGAAARARQMGVTNILLSLSHAGGQAVAVVILEG